MQRKKFLAAAGATTAALGAPRFTLAAGPAATVTVGFLDSFSGIFSDLGAVHRAGGLLALEDANRRGRVKYQFVFGDDGSKPAIATTEAQRLIGQEKVDVLCGGTSSANGLALGEVALRNGIFNLLIGPQDSSITGA
jgi:branched-chain amino acid transport system substrate-binding protein